MGHRADRARRPGGHDLRRHQRDPGHRPAGAQGAARRRLWPSGSQTTTCAPQPSRCWPGPGPGSSGRWPPKAPTAPASGCRRRAPCATGCCPSSTCARPSFGHVAPPARPPGQTDAHSGPGPGADAGPPGDRGYSRSSAPSSHGHPNPNLAPHRRHKGVRRRGTRSCRSGHGRHQLPGNPRRLQRAACGALGHRPVPAAHGGVRSAAGGFFGAVSDHPQPRHHVEPAVQRPEHPAAEPGRQWSTRWPVAA
jgi:hypothetical protein